MAIAAGRATTPQRLAEDACTIEIDILGEPIGKQDQYAAAHGGICAYTFHQDDSVTVEPLDISAMTSTKLRENLLLFYTGETRSAGAILSDQDVRTRSMDSAMLQNLDRTRAIGYQSRDLLLSGDLESYGGLMDEHWRIKRDRSPGMSSDRINALYELALRNGAIGGKLVGAGGGGFLLIYTSDPEATRAAFAALQVKEVPFSFDHNGCHGSIR